MTLRFGTAILQVGVGVGASSPATKTAEANMEQLLSSSSMASTRKGRTLVADRPPTFHQIGAELEGAVLALWAEFLFSKIAVGTRLNYDEVEDVGVVRTRRALLDYYQLLKLVTNHQS